MSDILFDGTQITWQGKNYKATSGLPGHQNAKFQQKPDLGPVPAGTYRVRLVDNGMASVVLETENGISSYDMPAGWGLESVPRTATINGRVVDVWGQPGGAGFQNWGPNRLRLINKKIDDPAAAKRDGFYLHDSGKGFSHGCIEVDTQFFSDIRSFMKSNPKIITQIVQVKYPANDTITNGGTGTWSRQSEESAQQRTSN